MCFLKNFKVSVRLWTFKNKKIKVNFYWTLSPREIIFADDSVIDLKKWRISAEYFIKKQFFVSVPMSTTGTQMESLTVKKNRSHSLHAVRDFYDVCFKKWGFLSFVFRYSKEGRDGWDPTLGQNKGTEDSSCTLLVSFFFLILKYLVIERVCWRCLFAVTFRWKEAASLDWKAEISPGSDREYRWVSSFLSRNQCWGS